MTLSAFLIPATLLLGFLTQGKKIFIFISLSCLSLFLIYFRSKRSYEGYILLFTLFLILFSLPLLIEKIREKFWVISSQTHKTLEDLNATGRDIEGKKISVSKVIESLERQNAAVSDLYEMTKEMSCLLHFAEIFKVFQGILYRNFSFKDGFLVTLRHNVSVLEIDKIYKISQDSTPGLKETYLPHASYYKVLEHLYHRRESAYINRDSSLRRQFGLTADSDLEFSLLKIENRIIGALVLEGMPQEEIDKFSVFSTQFSLELKKVNLYEQIEELATTDSLTGLYVRRKILESTREELERAARHKMSLAFIMLDIDYFKNCNDKYGHLAGDYVLKEIARILNTNLREIDLVGRYGGEEFSIILPDTNLDEARIVSQRILEAVRNYSFKAYGEEFKVTVSSGVAVFPEDGDTPLKLIDNADRALYAAKNRGRNRSIFYNEIAS